MKMMNIFFIIILGFACFSRAAGPLYRNKDVVTQQEFDNVYQDIKNIAAQPGASLNVKDFGAAGNGSTLDTNAIQLAINACSAASSALYFPPGIYISTQVIVKSNCALFGADKYLSTISFPQSNITNMNFSMFETTLGISNFSISDLGLRGNRAFQTTAFTNGAFDGYAIGLFGGPVANVEFDNVYISSFGNTAFTNIGGGAIQIAPTGADSSCTNIRCTNSVFGNNDKLSGFYLDASEGTTGSSRNIYVVGNSFMGGFHNDTVYILGGYGASSAKRIYNVTIDKNNFYNTEDSDSNVEVNGTYSFSINENKFTYTTSGIAHCALIRSDCANGSFNNNQITSFSTDTSKPGVHVVAFSNGEHQDNIHIEGNSWFVSTGTSNLVKVQKGSRRVMVRNNIFLSTPTAMANTMGIGDAQDVDVVGNYFENVVTPIIISEGIDPPTSRIRIKDNRFNNCGGSGGVHIVTTGGAIPLNGLIVEGNISTNTKSISGGATFASISVVSNVGNIIRDNIIYGGLAVIDSVTPWSVIDRNIGYNPVGPSAITVTASPFVYTSGVVNETVYIYGGSVSDVSVNSISISTLSPVAVNLPAGKSVTVTYSNTPTMKKYIQ